MLSLVRSSLYIFWLHINLKKKNDIIHFSSVMNLLIKHPEPISQYTATLTLRICKTKNCNL